MQTPSVWRGSLASFLSRSRGRAPICTKVRESSSVYREEVRRRACPFLLVRTGKIAGLRAGAEWENMASEGEADGRAWQARGRRTGEHGKRGGGGRASMASEGKADGRAEAGPSYEKSGE